MPLRVHPISEDHLHTCFGIYRSAMGPMPADRAIFPSGATPALTDFIITLDSGRLRTERNGWYVGVSDSETGELIAYAHWRLEDEIEHQREREEIERGEEDPRFPDSNSVGVKIFYPAMDKSHERAMGTKSHWHLALVVTKAGQERRGAGRLLVEWGTARADRDKLETFLYGSQIAKPLYERCGFQAVGEDSLDFGACGVNEIDVWWPMVRQPQAPKPDP